MKLVDILARELKEWPGDYATLCQSKFDSEIYGSKPGIRPERGDSLHPPHGLHLSVRHTEKEEYPVVTRAQWQAAVEALRDPLPALKNPLPIPNVVAPKQEAIDWSKAPEGATHWDASPDRTGSFMKVGEDGVYFWPPTSDTPSWCHWLSEPDEHFIPRPMPWNGEGLPPVGVTCEYSPHEGKWEPVTVFARKPNVNGSESALFDRADSWGACANAGSFRPIRTPEQIAAEERKAAVNELRSDMEDEGVFIDQRMAEIIHDAGYRKQVQP